MTGYRFYVNIYGFRESRAHDIALLRITVGMDDIMWLNDTVLPASSFGVSGNLFTDKAKYIVILYTLIT